MPHHITISQLLAALAIVLYILVVYSRNEYRKAERRALHLAEIEKRRIRYWLVAFDYIQAAEWCHTNGFHPREECIVIITRREDAHGRIPRPKDRIIDLGGPAYALSYLRANQLQAEG